MTLAAKLQLKPGQAIRVLNAPKGFALDLPASAKAAPALLFAGSVAELEKLAPPLLAGLEGVRLVSIDETWSAMRFRPVRR